MIKGLVNGSIWSPEKSRVYLINTPSCEEVKLDYQFKTKNRKKGSTSVVKTLALGDCGQVRNGGGEGGQIEDDDATGNSLVLIGAVAGGGSCWS